jgi:protein ImuB
MTTPSLWLAADLPRLPLTALADPRPQLVVTQARGRRRWLIAGGDAALRPGEDLGAARQRRPDLIAVEREPSRETASIEALACCALRYGEHLCWRVDEPEADYALPRFTLWLEIGPSLKLFGGLDALLTKLENDFAALGHPPRFGVAPTLEAAAALARHRGGIIRDQQALPAALARIPLQALSLPLASLALLADIGIRDTAGLLALPRSGLAKRIGTDTLTLLDRILGLRDDPRRWYRPPPRYARTLDLLDEIEDSERLLFPLRRLISEFGHYLAARDSGVQQFRLELLHDRRAEVPATTLEIALSQPGRDETLLLRVVRERLAALQLLSPVRGLKLTAERFAHPGARQQDLFDRRRQTDDEADAALDRLRARLGDNAVWRPVLADDHRPERAWQADNVLDPAHCSSIAPPAAPRPLWLLREPRLLQRPPPVDTDVERIESGWWDGNDLRRDYFGSELTHGVRAWIYSDHRDGQLYLHGLWS